MDNLITLLNAYLQNSLSLDDFSEHFVDFWNDIRIEHNREIESAGIRDTLDALWKQYRAGKLDEVTYGRQWTKALSSIDHVRIPPQSIVYALGNQIYNSLTLLQESEHLDDHEIPTAETIRGQIIDLRDAIGS